MKKEEKVKDKNKKKNKVIKILLGIGAAVGAIYVANKYVPGFNEKVVKPVKNLANTVKNDIEKSFDEPEQQPQCQENHKRFVKENNIQPKRKFDCERNRDRNNDDRVNHRNHRRNHEQRRERNNFN